MKFPTVFLLYYKTITPQSHQIPEFYVFNANTFLKNSPKLAVTDVDSHLTLPAHHASAMATIILIGLEKRKLL